jgi:MoaA/NifB/PqqE/SkfB family radical SAM enzyme
MATFADHIADRTARASGVDVTNPQLPGLSTVELNPTELCNRRCSFCPRVDPQVYPNRALHMTIETAAKVANDLHAANFGGDIHVTGFGEPLLHPDLPALIQTLRLRLRHNHLEITTNGDRLTATNLEQLLQAGLDRLIVNCYDGPEQVEQQTRFLESFGLTPAQFRIRANFDDRSVPVVQLLQSYGFTNRSGAAAPPPPQPRERACYLPFYKLLIDWNGDVLLCCNDWLRRQSGLGNIHEHALHELWMGPELQTLRAALLRGERTGPACRLCDVDGTRVGAASAEIFQRQMQPRAA